MFAFFNNPKDITPATVKKMIEYDFMETFHYTPKQISQIPMKKMQEVLLIKRTKNEAIELKMKMDKVRSQSASAGRGSSKRTYREV